MSEQRAGSAAHSTGLSDSFDYVNETTTVGLRIFRALPRFQL
ncbi:hypothetical protein MPC1_3220003 [Methylocella tundrae]|nr:hypothetical protein MPC1_3220003 [Methylocella tundrae]